MITISTLNGNSHVLQPTIFPDGTSQVWKLPDWTLEATTLEVTWNFEAEREILDLLSLRKLLVKATWDLHIPFLPYARQDKDVSNTSTFNLEVLADLINSLGCRKVTAVDVHNPAKTAELIKNFENVKPTLFWEAAIRHSEPQYIVFPDAGARSRYGSLTAFKNFNAVVCDKKRDPLTGQIVGHQVAEVIENNYVPSFTRDRFLIVDDLCDGGATFISVAKMIREENKSANVDLCVAHGVFSKGRFHLLSNGINNVFTTNSLTKNEDGYKV